MFQDITSLCASVAETPYFYGNLLGMEGMTIAPLGEPIINLLVAEFGHQAAILADGESGHVVVVGVLAGYIGVKALQTVGEPFLDQLVEGAIHRRWRHGSFAAHLVEHFISRERILCSRQDTVDPLLRLVQLIEGMSVVVMGRRHK